MLAFAAVTVVSLPFDTNGQLLPTGSGALDAQLQGAMWRSISERRRQESEQSLVAVVLTMGCTGSSAMMQTLQSLLEKHGMSSYPVAGGQKELFKCDKNPQCAAGTLALSSSPSLTRNKGNATGALEAMVNEARAQRQFLLVKGGPMMDSTPEQMEMMHSMGARAVALRRANTLSQLVCNIRDCLGDNHARMPVWSSNPH